MVRKRGAGRLFLFLSPVILACVVFVSVLRVRPTPLWRKEIPHEEYRDDRCTWACHNRNCPHRSMIPGWLTSDSGAFGKGIHALRALGRFFSRDRLTGYWIANIVVFCIAWPLVAFGLWMIVVRQHALLGAARNKRRE